MTFFDKYTSNTLAGSGNQSFFETGDKDIVIKCRTLYKVFCGGEYNYSFLLSNTVDSTFADGSFSQKNKALERWTIHGMRVGITDLCDERSLKEPNEFFTLSFGGKTKREVGNGELLNTDAIRLSPNKGEYLCVEIEFSGLKIPCHPESIVPSFVFKDGAWTPSRLHPFVSMVGCDREVKGRIAFWGDSITQGIGTENNSYAHWNALVADYLGTDYAYWNLGLGYGRADDAASDGIWMHKALQNDIIVVCYGVNDILRGFSEQDIKKNLNTIVDKLISCGKKVVVQTVPPFDFVGDKLAIWNNVNAYIRTELSQKAEFVFDCAPLLGKNDAEPNVAKFGGHPNAEGCKLWASALSKKLKKYLNVQ